MPKGRPKKIDPNKELLEKLKVDITELKDRVLKLEAGSQGIKVVAPSSPSVDLPHPLKTDDQSFPVPLEYRQVVDNILNKHFDIKVAPRDDAPLLELSIIVPDKYSSLTPAQKAINGGDLRLKVLNIAEGANGVRDYVQKIWETFTPEVKGQIFADRV